MVFLKLDRNSKKCPNYCYFLNCTLDAIGKKMTLLRSILLVLLFIVPVLAQDANESREQRRERNFARRDTNKDGRISREEFSGGYGRTRSLLYFLSWYTTKLKLF